MNSVRAQSPNVAFNMHRRWVLVLVRAHKTLCSVNVYIYSSDAQQKSNQRAPTYKKYTHTHTHSRDRISYQHMRAHFADGVAALIHFGGGDHMCVFARATNESRCLIGSRCDAQALTYGVLWVREPAERRLFGHNEAPSTEWWCALRTASPFNWGSGMGRGEKGDSTDRGGICNINNFYEAFFLVGVYLLCLVVCCPPAQTPTHTRTRAYTLSHTYTFV